MCWLVLFAYKHYVNSLTLALPSKSGTIPPFGTTHYHNSIHTGEYVSQIESGNRRLDRIDQVIRLADILEIPYERLEAIEKGIPQQKIMAETLQQTDDAPLRALLKPAQTTVKLSWLVWYGNNDASIVDNLSRITEKLEDAIANRRGVLLKPALELLAYRHEMLGKIAFDQLNYTDASGHFQDMLHWEPQKATEIYKESEQFKPFRPMRDLGVLTILKAQAYAYAGAIDEGGKFGLKGLELARGYESKRHSSRVQRMYDRLSVTPLGKEKDLQDLDEALKQK